MTVDIDALLYRLKSEEFEARAGRRHSMGHALYLSALRLEDGERPIIASAHGPAHALERDGPRRQSETALACSKGRGFRFEATRLTDLARSEKTTVALALTFAWAHYVGDWRHRHKPIEAKKHGRLATRYFR